MKTTRREFIKECAVVTSAAAVVCVSGCSAGDGVKSAFSPEQRECFVAVMECFIPADESCGGATEAGCINFLENWVTRYHPEQLESFKDTADKIDAACAEIYSQKFCRLAPEKQNAFLKDWEQGKVKFPKEFKSGAAFNNLLNVAMMGFYGSPRHGGNKDFMSYRMMGLDVPLLIGQNRYGKSASERLSNKIMHSK